MKIEYLQNIDVNVLPTREMVGEVAGMAVEKQIVELLKKKESIRIIFAAAPSQNELLDYLVSSKKIEWNRIIAFNMDEYIGMNNLKQQSFAYYLNQRLFSKLNLKNVHLINGSAPVENEIQRFSDLLIDAPIDIVCLGIGENGHIAFNDPPVANFEDPKIVKSVELDESCRMQQVNDECFKNLGEVPKKAFTITIPVIMSANSLFCVVLGRNKHEAVYNTLNGPIDTSCPSSILREHKNCKFYFDDEAFGNVPKK
jgi:glucosamine-6-phosphate deaminase